ncbi:GTP-binding protein [Coniosporium tulheliwenetii]|uniref:GTP-binding protein n=1 Tax=Coniosporium tulheliwenetii TaxID=3383036 RepID=A0ACC2Z5S0_9PEZI|nr:GTP-binding protein [Cladosporium sp. JES 115]
MPAPPKQRKIAVVGSRSVGKSSLTVRFVDGHFVESYYPTIENTFSKLIRLKNGQEFATEIIDTAGQDEYSILNSKHFIGVHGYIIVFSVASKQSYEMVEHIKNKILDELGVSWVPIVVIANKTDLRPEQKVIGKEDFEKLEKKLELDCPIIKCSARFDENVNKAFEQIIMEIERGPPKPNEPAGGGKCLVM